MARADDAGSPDEPDAAAVSAPREPTKGSPCGDPVSCVTGSSSCDEVAASYACACLGSEGHAAAPDGPCCCFHAWNEALFTIAPPTAGSSASSYAIATWLMSLGPSAQDAVIASVFSTSNGWAPSTVIESQPQSAAEPAAAINGTGTALIVWVAWNKEETGGTVWARRYEPATGWSAPTDIGPTLPGAGITDTKVVVDAAANASVVWSTYDGERYRVWSNYLSADKKWGEPTAIDDPGAPSATNAGVGPEPDLGMDGAGRVIAVWAQYDGAHYTLWSNRYTPGSGWGAATSLQMAGMFDPHTPRVAVEHNGDAMAVWSERATVVASRYVSGGGWQGPHKLGDGSAPRVASDDAGNFLAAWLRVTDDLRSSSVLYSRYSIGEGWGSAMTAFDEPYNDKVGYVPMEVVQLALDQSGNIILAWNRQVSPFSDHAVIRWTRSAGWSRSSLLISEPLNTSGLSALARGPTNLPVGIAMLRDRRPSDKGLTP